MRLTCPHCGDTNELPATHVPPAGARGSCGRCGQVAVFDGRQLVAEGGDATPPNPLDAAGDDATPPNPLAAASDDATPAHPLDAVAAQEEASAAGDAWHVNTPAGQQGPLTLNDLKLMIRKDELSEADHVYGPGQTDWIAAGQREELHRYFAIKAKQRAGAGATAAAGGVAGATTAAASQELNVNDPFAWCTRHHTIEASFICHGCNLSWCRTCPGEKQLPSGQMRVCPNCDRPVSEREKAKPITLWWTELGKVFSFPLQGARVIALIILSMSWFMGFMMSGAGIYGFIGRVIVYCGIVSWFLLLVRNLGEGREGMPDMGKVERYGAELFWPGFKACVVQFLCYVPLILYLLFVIAPAVLEYGMASAQVEMAEAERQAEEQPSWASDDDAGGDEEVDEQREALIEAWRSMGMSEEEIDATLAEWDAEEGGGSSGGWEDDGWEDPWQPPEPPSAAGLFLKLLGVPLLLAYALCVWPLLFIILAMFNTMAPVFNPALLIDLAKQAWPEYRRMLLFVIPMGLVAGGFEWMIEPSLERGAQLESWGFPPFARVLFVPVYWYLQIVIYYVIGRTAELFDRKIDWA